MKILFISANGYRAKQFKTAYARMGKSMVRIYHVTLAKIAQRKNFENVAGVIVDVFEMTKKAIEVVLAVTIKKFPDQEIYLLIERVKVRVK